VDSTTGEVGSAGASCLDATQTANGCVIISDVHPGQGVIHTQALHNASNQRYAGELLDKGIPPEAIIDSLVAHDAQNNPGLRQYGIADLNGGHPRVKAYTGTGCTDWKGHIEGRNYSIQGNILLGRKVLDSMEVRFLRESGDLACKLMAALQGAKMVGADTRCRGSGNSSLSSFLRIARPSDTAGTISLNLIVPKGPSGFEPIDSLQALFDKNHACSTQLVAAAGRVSRRNISVSGLRGVTSVVNEFPFQEYVLVLYTCAGDLLVRIHFNGADVAGIRIPRMPRGMYFYSLRGLSSNITLSGKFLIVPWSSNVF
jgi:uncharacterized Ntn-hydrolase superfamily protein